MTVIVLAAVGAAACGRQQPPTPVAAADAPPKAPAAVGPPAYEGRWAASAELCSEGAWEFRQDGLSTAGEVSCRFTKVEPTASSYRIQTACTHEGSESRREIELSMTDPASPQSMTVEGGPWSGPITLRRCPA